MSKNDPELNVDELRYRAWIDSLVGWPENTEEEERTSVPGMIRFTAATAPDVFFMTGIFVYYWAEHLVTINNPDAMRQLAFDLISLAGEPAGQLTDDKPPRFGHHLSTWLRRWNLNPDATPE